MKLFAQLTKVDEDKRLVIGRAVQEVPDLSDEIFDYASSKPHFEEWSKAWAADTDGQSLGNLRAMHGKVSAGKLTDIAFLDDERAIDIAAKVVDDNEWQKVLEGCYRGFSIGGSYVGDRKTEKLGDGREVMRYTAKPIEISLVDTPCIPTAKFFDVVKSDGSTLQKAFQDAAPASPGESGAPATPDPESSSSPASTVDHAGAPAAAQKAEEPALTVAGSDDQVAAFAKLLNDTGTSMGDAIAAVEYFVADRSLATMAADDAFPIAAKADVALAVRAYGKATNKAKVKAHIVAKAQELDAVADLPAAWRSAAKAAAPELRKGLWVLSSFVSAIETLADVARSAQWDAEAEGDGSPVPAKLRNALEDILDIFREMADEETSELLAGLRASAGVASDGIEQVIAAAAAVNGLRKRLADPDLGFPELYQLAQQWLGADELNALKAGQVGGLAKAIIDKAASKVDAARVQEIHDHATGMGAVCAAKAAEEPNLHKGLAYPALVEKLEAAEKRLAALEAQPMPSRTAALGLIATTTATKAADSASVREMPSDEQLLKDFAVLGPDGSVDTAATAIKLQQKLNGRPIAVPS